MKFVLINSSDQRLSPPYNHLIQSTTSSTQTYSLTTSLSHQQQDMQQDEKQHSLSSKNTPDVVMASLGGDEEMEKSDTEISEGKKVRGDEEVGESEKVSHDGDGGRSHDGDDEGVLRRQAKVGVRRVWVQKQHRRNRIASRLLTAVRSDDFSQLNDGFSIPFVMNYVFSVD